ncbi:MAG: inositol monophosphatase [Phycisphaerae bacterium]|nr:inositol monophosphatase [Phycisphaerae bacterium]
MSAETAGLRQIAVGAALAGGLLARRMRSHLLDVRLKHDGSEVSEADLRAQELVVRTILAARPHDRILGEETLAEPATAATGAAGGHLANIVHPAARPLEPHEVCWIIDPIDGTRNYVRGLPGYGCAVAAMRGGRTIAAATYDVSDDCMYSASVDEGFFIGGERFDRARADARRGRTAKLLIAVPSGVAGDPRRLIEAWFAPHLLRNYGAAALHLCYIAAGGLDAMLAADCRLWDLAGGALFVEAMGGKIARLDGSPLFPFDVNSYRGEPLTSLFARDEATHVQLLSPLTG